MLVDTHTHLYMPELADGEAHVRKAVATGVEKMIMPNVDASTVPLMLDLCHKFPGVAYPTLGLHPSEVYEDADEIIDRMESQLKADKKEYAAIGEVGIDLYWDKSHRKEQIQAFKRQFDLARELDLPLIIHCRKGLDEVLSVVNSDVPMVFHCFTGSPEEVKQILRKVPEAYFGIGGVVTFKNSGLKDTLPTIGLDKIVLETDSPFLAPVPHRGQPNTSAYVPLIRDKIAEFMNVSPEEVEERTTLNAFNLFPKLKD